VEGIGQETFELELYALGRGLVTIAGQIKADVRRVVELRIIPIDVEQRRRVEQIVSAALDTYLVVFD
jgi:hypothetical protein